MKTSSYSSATKFKIS